MNAVKRHIPPLAGALLCVLCVVEAVHWNKHRLHTRPHHGALPNAYFIVRPDECEGVFDFLALFDRPEIVRRIEFDGIYVLGNATDSVAVSAIARAHDLRTTIRRADAAIALQHDALGYRQGVLVITDAEERVLLARGVPSSPAAYVALAVLLTSSPI